MATFNEFFQNNILDNPACDDIVWTAAYKCDSDNFLMIVNRQFLIQIESFSDCERNDMPSEIHALSVHFDTDQELTPYRAEGNETADVSIPDDLDMLVYEAYATFDEALSRAMAIAKEEHYYKY